MGCGAGKEATDEKKPIKQQSSKSVLRFSVIVVGGASLIGREVVRQCLRNKWQVRVATRTPKSQMARVLESMGATICAVKEPTDPECRPSLVNAASMMDAAVIIPPFLGTDVSGCLCWIEALAVAATVKRAVLVTSVFNYPASSSLGDFDQKLRAELKKHAPYFQNNFAEVRASLVTQGWLKHWGPSIIKEHKHKHPFGDLKFAWVDAVDVASVAVRLVLPFQKSKGQVVCVRGPTPMTHAEFAKKLSGALGAEIECENITVDAWASIMEAELGGNQVHVAGARELVDFGRSHPEEFAQVDDGEFEALMCSKLMTVDDFIADNFKPAFLSRDPCLLV